MRLVNGAKEQNCIVVSQPHTVKPRFGVTADRGICRPVCNQKNKGDGGRDHSAVVVEVKDTMRHRVEEMESIIPIVQGAVPCPQRF